MSALSSIANVLATIGLAGNKNDAKSADGAFLSLLAAGGAQNFLGGEQQTQQSLVDSLYEEKEKTPDPVAVAVQAPQVFANQPLLQGATPYVENVQAASVRREEAPVKPDDAPAATPEQAVQAVQAVKEKPTAPQAIESKEPVETAQAVQPTDAAEKTTSPTAASTDGIAEEIRAKIKQLSDILSQLGSLLGVGQVTVQVTQVQITQTSITSTNALQSTLGVNQPFVDLSDRFKQLIAAVSSSQNLPSATDTSLNITFRSFQALFVSLAGGNQAANSASNLQNVAALPSFDQHFFAGCKSCETQLTIATATVATSIAGGTKSLPAGLGEQLQKLQQWIGEFQTIAKEASAVNKGSVDAVVTQLPTITSDAVKTSVTAAVAVNDNNVASAAPTLVNVTPVAPVVTAAQPIAPQNSAAIAVAAIQNNTGTEANLSGGNSNNGQGGAQPQTAPVGLAAASAANVVTNAQAPSFAKTLSMVKHSPVVEQVAFNIKAAAKDGSSNIEINLDPASLGKVSVKLSTDAEGKTAVVVTADNKETLALLQRDARGLEQALSDAGLKADSGSLSFNLRGGNQGQQGEKRTDFAGYTALIEEEDALASLAIVSKNYVVNVTDGLNIQI